MSNTRVILNSNEGITNYVSGENLRDIFLVTLNEIIDVLSEHCGPSSTDALVVVEQGLGHDNANVFTKDGIHILNNVEFVSPIQTYIKELITYIGTRVDSMAHDGTTSSMLLASHLLKYALTQKNKRKEDKSLSELGKELKSKFDTILCMFNKYKVNISDICTFCTDLEENELRAIVAYMQSMVSSKKDIELSKCMYEIFKHTPKELYSLFTYKRDPVETDQAYRVEYPKHHFEIEAFLGVNKPLNSALGTEYKNVTDLIVADNHLAIGYAETDMLLDYLKSREDSEDDLVILASSASPDIITAINKCPGVYMFLYNDRLKNHTYPELRVLAASADRYTTTTSFQVGDWIIPNVLVHFKGNKLYLTIAIIDSFIDQETKVHEFHYTDKNSLYTETCHDLEELIDKSQHSHHLRVNELEEYIRIYKNMLNPIVPSLVVSGKTMDNHSNNTVVEDTLGAITSTLEHGFVIDGNAKLAMIAKQIDYPILQKSIASLLDIIYGDENDVDLQFPNLHEDIEISKYQYYDMELDKIRNIDFLNRFGIIQPYKLYNELFSRIVEVLPKILNTSKVIVPGSAYTKNED
jgi:CYTH domain-containing protein